MFHVMSWMQIVVWLNNKGHAACRSVSRGGVVMEMDGIGRAGLQQLFHGNKKSGRRFAASAWP
jgi:hypothetical protein